MQKVYNKVEWIRYKEAKTEKSTQPFQVTMKKKKRLPQRGK